MLKKISLVSRTIIVVSFLYINAYTEDQNTIEKALSIVLSVTDTFELATADEINKVAFKQVMNGDYGAALAMVLDGLEQFPTNFDLQAHLASLIGDYAGMFSGALKEQMVQRSKEIFDKLLNELEGQPKSEYFYFKNEYYFRFGFYKEQYELGLERLVYYWGTDVWNSYAHRCYYTQGVGAAQYARQLVIEGNEQLALEYAHKALVAWAQYFTYRNDYYNSYVHYALALGILGHKNEMVCALQHAASIINKDLTFPEFKEVIDFIESKMITIES